MTMVPVPGPGVPPAWRGPPILVAHQVPDHPAFRPVVEVVDDVPGEAECRGPIAADAAFRVEQVFVGEGVVDDSDIIPVVARVPVEGSAPDVLGGFLVVVGGLDTLIDEAAVMVPDHEFNVRQAGFLKSRAEEVLNEVLLLVTLPPTQSPPHTHTVASP